MGIYPLYKDLSLIMILNIFNKLKNVNLLSKIIDK